MTLFSFCLFCKTLMLDVMIFLIVSLELNVSPAKKTQHRQYHFYNSKPTFYLKLFFSKCKIMEMII